MEKFPTERLEALFQALADRTRLRLLNLLVGEEMCVCYFVEALRTTQPKISRHLAYLRRSGLVTAQRNGKWIHYQLRLPASPQFARILRLTLETIASDPQMQKDRARLQSISRAPQKFVQIQSGPLPTAVPCCPEVSDAQ